MNSIAARIFCAFVLGCALCLASPAQSEDINVDQAKKLMADKPSGLVILDVRTPDEFRSGHITGARNMDFFGAGFESEAVALDRNAPTLVYCRTGVRSAAAADILEKQGVKKVMNMKGGIVAWHDKGLPVTSPEKKAR